MVFIEIKHKTDLDATYFKLHLIIIKFPTLEISSESSGGFTVSRMTFLKAFIYTARCSSSETKNNLHFLIISLHTQSNKHIFWL